MADQQKAFRSIQEGFSRVACMAEGVAMWAQRTEWRKTIVADSLSRAGIFHFLGVAFSKA